MRHWAHLLVDEGCGANLNIDCTDGPCVRRAAIVRYGGCENGKELQVAWKLLFVVGRFEVLRAAAAEWKLKGRFISPSCAE